MPKTPKSPSLQRQLRRHLKATSLGRISCESFRSWFLETFAGAYASEGDQLECMIDETADVLASFYEGSYSLHHALWALGVAAVPLGKRDPKPKPKPRANQPRPKTKAQPQVLVNAEARMQARLAHLEMIRRLMIAPVPGAQHRGTGSHRPVGARPL